MQTTTFLSKVDNQCTITTRSNDKSRSGNEGKKENHANDSSKVINKYNFGAVRAFSTLYGLLMLFGFILISFSAGRYHFTWQMQNFWRSCGDFWQEKWESLLSITGDDEFFLMVVCSLILTTALYWTVGGLYTILDITNKPAFIRKYKVQPGTNEPVDSKRLFQVILQVLFNQIAVGFPVAYLAFLLMKWRGFQPIRELPSLHWTILELACLILIEEAGFYYSHRLLHHRFIYKFIHKKHHEWTAPISVTAVYCHPIEHVVSNLLPPLLGVFLMKSHVTTAWFWFCLAHLNTLNAHSGYHLPFFSSPEAHDFHHLKFNQCYGVLGLLDRLHGTDDLFRSSKAYVRHIMMMSLTPARIAFPDVKE